MSDTVLDDFVDQYKLGVQQVVGGSFVMAERTLEGMYLSFQTLNLTPDVSDKVIEYIGTLEYCLKEKQEKVED